MKTLIITAGLLFISVASFAQKAKFNTDSTITYLKNNFKKGQTVQILYGSGSDKTFAFIKVVEISMTKIKHYDAPADFSKHTIVINNTSVKDGKCYLSGKVDWMSTPDDYVKIEIDLEGAIDNKEITI